MSLETQLWIAVAALVIVGLAFLLIGCYEELRDAIKRNKWRIYRR